MSTSNVGLFAISPPSRYRSKALKYVGAAPEQRAARHNSNSETRILVATLCSVNKLKTVLDRGYFRDNARCLLISLDAALGKGYTLTH